MNVRHMLNLGLSALAGAAAYSLGFKDGQKDANLGSIPTPDHGDDDQDQENEETDDQESGTADPENEDQKA